MSWTSARTDIYTRWLANSPVPAGRNDTSMFNGPEFSPPAPDFSTPANATWMRLQVETTPTTGIRLGIGNAPRYREGTILSSFFFMPETGEDELGIMDTFLESFDQEQFGIVTTLEPDEPDAIGRGESGSWAQYNSTIPFYVVEEPGSDVAMSEHQLIESDPAAHGFTAGKVVGFSDDNSEWETIVATSAAEDFQFSPIGFVYHVPNVNSFMVATGGTVRLTGHGFGTGPLYVDQSTAGAVTTTKPTSGVLWNIGTAIDANRVTVLQRQPIQL